MGDYIWDKKGQNSDSAACGKSLLAMASFLAPCFQRFPDGMLNHVFMVAAFKTVLEDYPAMFKDKGMDSVAAQLSGSVRTMLKHCRRLKQSEQRWKQACKRMSVAERCSLREVLDVLGCKWHHEAGCDAAYLEVPCKEQKQYVRSVRSASSESIGAVGSGNMDIWSQSFDGASFGEAVSRRGGLKALARQEPKQASAKLTYPKQPKMHVCRCMCV